MPPQSSALRAFGALVLFSMKRHAKVRQLAWVAFALLAILSAVVLVSSNSPVGWRLETRTRSISDQKDEKGENPIRVTYKQYGDERLPIYEVIPSTPEGFGLKMAVASAYRAIMQDRQFLDDFAFLSFVRVVVYGYFLSFLLPLLTLAYASGAFGAEREGRTMLWLLTRPLPRWAVYLAKYLGTMPWCVGISALAFTVLCLCGGEYGRRAIALSWPAVLAGSLAFGSLFHLIGALFRWPSVIGLVYVFFFEILVGALPGSLKHLSLNYYIRSLFYNETAGAIARAKPENVDAYAPTDPTTAWVTLLAASLLLTLLGMWLFGRQEPKDGS
jgi:ABC-2 type transport system permease protein